MIFLYVLWLCQAGNCSINNSESYKESILPSSVTNRVSIEMGISLGWDRYVGPEGKMMSIETFGASGTGSAVMELFGFTTENVVKTVKSLIKAKKGGI